MNEILQNNHKMDNLHFIKQLNIDDINYVINKIALYKEDIQQEPIIEYYTVDYLIIMID